MKHPGQVVTGSKDTDILEGAFINILAGPAVWGWGEAHLTLAAVSSRDIQALAVLTKVCVFRTLVNIWASKAVSREALRAGALVGAWGVDTLGVYAALVGSIRALIQINAFDAISHPAFSAAALEASRDIQTWGVHVAVMGANLTLVHVWETRVKKEKKEDEAWAG